jgi:excisionase family DNA binding protein
MLGRPRLYRVSPKRRFCVAMSEPWLSADDISAHLGVTKDTVYSWIADKAMPAHKIGRLWKFQASEVDEWVRSGGSASNETSPPG